MEIPKLHYHAKHYTKAFTGVVATGREKYLVLKETISVIKQRIISENVPVRQFV